MNNKKLAKDYIIEAFLQLLKKQGFENITITDIVKKAGVTRMTFYRNFNSKEEIIKSHLDAITDEFIKNGRILYKPNHFKEYITNIFTHLEKNRELALILYQSNILYFLKDEFDRIFLAKAKSRNEEYRYAFFSGGLYNLYYYWIKNNFTETPEKLADILNGFYTLKGNTD